MREEREDGWTQGWSVIRPSEDTSGLARRMWGVRLCGGVWGGRGVGVRGGFVCSEVGMEWNGMERNEMERNGSEGCGEEVAILLRCIGHLMQGE